MVCYARPAAWLAAIMAVAWLVFARPAGHFFDTAALTMAVTVVIAGAATSAALAVAVFMSVRRRRAAAGGCVNCQFRCQHAMTGSGRRAPGHLGRPGRPGTNPPRSVPVLLPMPAVRSAPRWPDRPAYRAGHYVIAGHDAAHRERQRAVAR
jgi:hypothetical protein